MMYAVPVIPSHLISWAEITLTGLALSVVSDESRDPVTSILSDTSAAWTAIGVAKPTTIPAFIAVLIVSQSFFRCILFMVPPG